MAGLARPSLGSRSMSNLMATRREYPTDAEQYELLEECGRGVSATVWRARCKPFDEIVAVKLMDLETVGCSLDDIVRETQTMRQLNHPNVLVLHVSFVHKQTLWMVEPYVAGGSMLNIMKYAYPEGLEEPVIATILREVLKGLDYMHKHEHIHRDVKAGNILVNTDGSVLLADFGVAATLERGGSWGNASAARSTFVGTPCWMAPEVMEQAQGYNALADIWSFGITVLELAHGHAPFARFPPMKVLLMTIQNPPPTLEQDSGKKHFSKAMRDVVAKCLVKDPAKRPTAAQLLEHKFFKTAHDKAYLAKHLLAGLPSVTKRVAEMRAGRAPGPNSSQAQAEVDQSQEAYVKGVSNWNFDVAALKASAALEVLPPVPEGAVPPEDEVLNGMSPLQQQPQSQQPPAASVLPPVETGVPASPPQQRAPAGATSRSAAKAAAPGSKLQGRFAVSTDDLQSTAETIRVSSNPNTPIQNRPLASQDSIDSTKEPVMRTLSQISLDSQDVGPSGAAAPGRKKGRFNIVAEDEGKSRVGRSTSVASFADKGAHAAPAATILLPSLKDCLEGMTAQHEMMKQLVAAVAEVERGKQAGLTHFLTEYADRAASRPSREDYARLKSELTQLKEENIRLKDRVRQMEADKASRKPTDSRPQPQPSPPLPPTDAQLAPAPQPSADQLPAA